MSKRHLIISLIIAIIIAFMIMPLNVEFNHMNFIMRLITIFYYSIIHEVTIIKPYYLIFLVELVLIFIMIYIILATLRYKKLDDEERKKIIILTSLELAIIITINSLPVVFEYNCIGNNGFKGIEFISLLNYLEEINSNRIQYGGLVFTTLDHISYIGSLLNFVLIFWTSYKLQYFFKQNEINRGVIMRVLIFGIVILIFFTRVVGVFNDYIIGGMC